jgi:hypothetical protein
MAYLLDANVFIDAKNQYYRFAVCPGFWDWLASANEKGIVLSIKQVRDELMKREDKLALWAKTHKKLFVDTDDGKTFESMRLLTTWVMEHYGTAAQAKFFGDADFYLVAFAHAHSHILVTHEVPSGGVEVKIPNACNAMDVRYMNTFEMLTIEKVKFDLRSN